MTDEGSGAAGNRHEQPLQNHHRRLDVDLKLPDRDHARRTPGRTYRRVSQGRTGVQNISYHRLLLKGRNTFGILMEPRHMWECYQIADARGEPLKIAIVLGYHPLLGIAASTGLPMGSDEYALVRSALAR
jgi:hypothetical protein